jgi:LPXTG-motif cell wall-anchored protein
MFRHELTGEPPSRGTPAAGRPAASRIPLVILLVAVTLIGLRGTLAAPHWDGPLHRDGTAVGAVFAVVLAALLTATLIRGHRAARRVAGQAEPELATVTRLRRWLRAALTTGLIAVVILTLISAHLHLFSGQPRPAIPPSVPQPNVRPSALASPKTGAPSSSLAFLLWGLLIALGVAAVVFGLVMVLRHRRPITVLPPGEVEFDPVDLRAAVTSGRTALRELDDARAAIIACYVAMEKSLAKKGAARAAADTPDELLTRATAEGIVHGTAARRLTRLFYEARFSRHPLTDADREQAGRALDELAGELREPGPAETGTAAP